MLSKFFGRHKVKTSALLLGFLSPLFLNSLQASPWGFEATNIYVSSEGLYSSHTPLDNGSGEYKNETKHSPFLAKARSNNSVYAKSFVVSFKPQTAWPNTVFTQVKIQLGVNNNFTLNLNQAEQEGRLLYHAGIQIQNTGILRIDPSIYKNQADSEPVNANLQFLGKSKIHTLFIFAVRPNMNSALDLTENDYIALAKINLNLLNREDFLQGAQSIEPLLAQNIEPSEENKNAHNCLADKEYQAADGICSLFSVALSPTNKSVSIKVNNGNLINQQWQIAFKVVNKSYYDTVVTSKLNVLETAKNSTGATLPNYEFFNPGIFYDGEQFPNTSNFHNLSGAEFTLTEGVELDQEFFIPITVVDKATNFSNALIYGPYKIKSNPSAFYKKDSDPKQFGLSCAHSKGINASQKEQDTNVKQYFSNLFKPQNQNWPIYLLLSLWIILKLLTQNPLRIFNFGSKKSRLNFVLLLTLGILLQNSLKAALADQVKNQENNKLEDSHSPVEKTETFNFSLLEEKDRKIASEETRAPESIEEASAPSSPKKALMLRFSYSYYQAKMLENPTLPQAPYAYPEVFEALNKKGFLSRPFFNLSLGRKVAQWAGYHWLNANFGFSSYTGKDWDGGTLLNGPDQKNTYLRFVPLTLRYEYQVRWVYQQILIPTLGLGMGWNSIWAGNSMSKASENRIYMSLIGEAFVSLDLNPVALFKESWRKKLKSQGTELISLGAHARWINPLWGAGTLFSPQGLIYGFHLNLERR